MTDELRAGRELDAACARAMGWVQRFSPDPTIYAWERPDGERVTMAQLPHFSTNWADVTLLEDEIARRGKINEYVIALAFIALDLDGEPPFDLFEQDMWLLLRATPEQRARAFLEAMKGAAE